MFGQMAVIGLMAVNQSNLTNGCSCIGELLNVLRCTPFQNACTPRGRAYGLIPSESAHQGGFRSGYKQC